MNLIRDPWIPVRDRHDERRLIALWQTADSSLVAPDWPRADLNVACLELLIGSVAMADPPKDSEDWEDRRAPDPERLRARLEAYAPAFNLTGAGPLFLQDLEPLEGEANSPDLLFIDSAGANTARNNADLMVRRDRYSALDPALAAMALYAFQAHAPSGGAGNRTSMRGGGPLVTLVDPGRGLWDMIWANTPYGSPAEMARLPWMRPTRISDKGQITTPADDVSKVEPFFGMPRRLRLVEQDGAIVGAIQRPSGANYAQWRHPLTPYYRLKAGEELLPLHPRAGRFGYRNWLGVLAQAEKDPLRERAQMLDLWSERSKDAASEVVVGGWAMDNMKPRDFTLSRQPFVDLQPEALRRLIGMIEAAEQAALALRAALAAVLSEGEARESEREAFYVETERAFLEGFRDLKGGAAPQEVAGRWLEVLRKEALRRFEAWALPALDQRPTDEIKRIVDARGFLLAAFKGHGKYGGPLFEALGMERPAKGKKKEKAA